MRYLGIDFGLRKVGLAVSEGELASPWQILKVKNFADALEKTAKIIEEEKFVKVIIGLPEGRMAENVKRFIRALSKRDIDVESSDETLSSKRALEQMIGQNIPLKKRRSNDTVAAAIILQNYLDSK